MLQRRHCSWFAYLALAFSLGAAVPACSGSVVVVECDGASENCDGECADLTSDPDNCGVCGNACGDGVGCNQGSCGVTACVAPDVECNGECADLLHDHDNCGGCGVDCEALFCENGNCVEACAPSLTPCDGACVDTQNDPDNCGNCAIECPSVCLAGFCAEGCSVGLTACNGLCVDTSNDAQNCGGCGIPCGFEESCVGGVCVGGVECPPGLTNCFGECADLFNDPDNCGFCGNDCGPSSACQNAGCTVPACDDPVCDICEVAFLPSTVPFSVTGNTSFTSDSFTPPCTGTAANEVLHVFTAPTDDLYTFDAIGTEFDSVLSLLDPQSCGVIDCNDDTFGLAAQIATFLSAGQTIFIVMDGFEDGFYQLNVNGGGTCGDGLSQCGGDCVDINFDQFHCGGCFQPCDMDEFCDFGFCQPLCNDECGFCAIVDLASSVPQTFSGSTSGLTDLFFPSCGFGSAGEQVHRFTAPSAASYTFSTAGSGFDTVLTLLDPFSCGEFACNDNFGGFSSSQVTLPLATGQEVLVSVDGNNVGGFYNLSVSSAAAPVCPTATLGTTLPVTVSGSTSSATNSFTPSCSPSSTAPEHTWSFTAPTSKQYQIDTEGSSYDTVLHVLGGACSGSTLACDDDAGSGNASLVSLFLNAGQTVTIVVDGFGGGSGSYQLHVQ